MDVIVASAGEAEYGAGFTAAQHAVNARTIAEELGHPPPATPILCDISFARNLAMDSCKQWTHANNVVQKQSTCAITGFEIAFDKTSSS
jgi:hypothetical protein